MDESSEHKISNKTIQSALEHAEQIAHHGHSVEGIGQAIGTFAGDAIAEHGRAIQEQINEGQSDLHQLQQTHSTKTYCKVAKDHAQATQALIEANQAFIRMNYYDLKRRGVSTLQHPKLPHASAIGRA